MPERSGSRPDLLGEFAADGIYLCGMAHYPKHIEETINQAYGAAGRVLLAMGGIDRQACTCPGSPP